ncbi:MAG: hypothetical protein KBG24_06515 [Bacteroidia bacterium]|nr:hypothetical protein [Bacteroidia bacterium]MBP9180130.1 hypothetical protein [Bacteroidia bacterium]MBP9725295.1 hypothetical protein [Bacteroidia bacterium]
MTIQSSPDLSFTNVDTQTMVNFIVSVGIQARKAQLSEGLPIPGISVENGVLLVDEDNLLYPGDLLYQAGRIAILPENERSQYMGKDDPNKDKEATEGMVAMCWAWAALTHLQLSPEIVFHNNGYKGQSLQIIHGYQSGAYMGLPMLQLYDMAYEPHQAIARGLNPFPFMYKWINK